MISPVNELSWGDIVLDKLSKVFGFCVKWLLLVDMQCFRSVFWIIREIEGGHDGGLRDVGDCRSRINIVPPSDGQSNGRMGLSSSDVVRPAMPR